MNTIDLGTSIEHGDEVEETAHDKLEGILFIVGPIPRACDVAGARRYMIGSRRSKGGASDRAAIGDDGDIHTSLFIKSFNDFKILCCTNYVYIQIHH